MGKKLSYELCNKADWQPRPSLVNQLNQTSFACHFDFGTVTKYKRRFKKEPAIYRNKDAVYSGMNSECLWIEQLEKKPVLWNKSWHISCPDNIPRADKSAQEG